MQKSTDKTVNATSPTQNSVEETHKAEYLATDEQLKDTPFVLRWRDGRGWFLTIGDTRITEPTKTKEETLERLEKEMWKLIAGMIVHIVKLLKNDDIVTHQTVEK